MIKRLHFFHFVLRCYGKLHYPSPTTLSTINRHSAPPTHTHSHTLTRPLAANVIMQINSFRGLWTAAAQRVASKPPLATPPLPTPSHCFAALHFGATWSHSQQLCVCASFYSPYVSCQRQSAVQLSEAAPRGGGASRGEAEPCRHMRSSVQFAVFWPLTNFICRSLFVLSQYDKPRQRLAKLDTGLSSQFPPHTRSPSLSLSFSLSLLLLLHIMQSWIKYFTIWHNAYIILLLYSYYIIFIYIYFKL